MKIRIKSVKSKIIVFFIGLAAFQICVMAGFAKLQLEPSIVSMYSEHLERFADVALTETTQETEKIERYMVNIIGDAQIQDFLRRADEEQSAELPPVLSTELRNRILSYTDYDNIITAIYLVDNYGRIYSNLGKSPMQTFMNRNQELKDRKEESAVWYGGENGNTITVYRNVNNNTTDLTQKIGALCIFIDRKMFQERIDDLMMEEEQHYVLEWGLRTWIEKDIIYRPVKMMMRILLAELFALLLVSIALVVFLSERITRPIRKLTIAMKEIGAGNIDTVVLDEGEDELGLLAATLNRMSKSIKKLMEQIHEDEKQKRYLELKAMQYQINPHFLYNTLDSIAMSARRNQDRQSEEMTHALAEFFRIGLSHGAEYVTVEMEVRYVKAYLEIQNMRFPDLLTWECSIEHGLEEIKILKFILQPLAENSIYHGFRDSGECGHIEIRVYTSGKNLQLCVSDNGIGMMPEQLEILKSRMAWKQMTEQSIQEGGFGLQNVQQRLQLVYGTKAGLHIESEWEEGTRITVVIPDIIKTHSEKEGSV